MHYAFNILLLFSEGSDLLKVFGNLKKKDRLFLAACVVLIVAQVWLELKMPDYTAKLTEAVSAGSIIKTEIRKNGAMMLLCAFACMLAAIVTGWLSSIIAADLGKILRTKLFDKVLSFSDKEMNFFTVPSLITRTTNDVTQMQMLISLGMHTLIKAPLLAVWAILKISSASVAWTGAMLVTVVVILVTLGVVIWVCYPRFKRIQTLTDALNKVTRENISGVRVVRAFNAEDYQKKKFDETNSAVTQNNLFTARTMGVMSPIMTMCVNGLTLAIYWIGAVLMNNAALPAERVAVIGNMTAFSQYAAQVVLAFMMIVVILILLPRAAVSAKRINEVLETEPSVTYPAQETGTCARGEIEFHNVSFAYPSAPSPCLENLSFHIRPGETFAVIGATGAGKTSLINLMARFFDCTEGEILLDGENIKKYSKPELEKRISLAPQKAILFKGDIKSNVTYGAEGEIADDDERPLRALEIARADFVDQQEEGVHASVAQGGTNFSGGQKQRLSIARAVYKDANIVILDDTFSALDYRTDMLVRRALREKMRGTTVVIVAQRIGTVRDADQILVLDEGRAVGLGRHEELLRSCSVYREIALSQLSKEEL